MKDVPASACGSQRLEQHRHAARRYLCKRIRITCFEPSLHMLTRGFVQDHGDENRSVFLTNKRYRPIFTASLMGWSVFDPDGKAMAQSPFFSRPAFCQTADVPKERFLSI
jgi:hypothetical protein